MGGCTEYIPEWAWLLSTCHGPGGALLSKPFEYTTVVVDPSAASNEASLASGVPLSAAASPVDASTAPASLLFDEPESPVEASRAPASLPFDEPEPPPDDEPPPEDEPEPLPEDEPEPPPDPVPESSPPGEDVTSEPPSFGLVADP
jgi:hypothetical protein